MTVELETRLTDVLRKGVIREPERRAVSGLWRVGTILLSVSSFVSASEESSCSVIWDGLRDAMDCNSERTVCQEVGVLSQNVKFVDRSPGTPGIGGSATDSKKLSTLWNFQSISLNILEPVALAFEARGYAEVALLRFGSGSTVSDFECLKNGSKQVVPGRYLLIGFVAGDIGQIKSGTASLAIEMQKRDSNHAASGHRETQLKEGSERGERPLWQLAAMGLRLGAIIVVLLLMIGGEVEWG